MISNHILLLLFCTVFYSTIYAWGVPKISRLGLKAIFDKENRIKNIMLFSVCFVLFSGSGYLVPEDLQESTIYGIFLGLGAMLWLGFKSNLEYKENYGELLFKSDRLSKPKRTYFLSILALCTGYVIFKNIEMIKYGTNTTNSMDEIWSTEIEESIYRYIIILYGINFTLYYLVSQWQKLEIRQQGIIFANTLTKWQDIIGFSWSDKKQDILEIEYQSKNEKVYKYKAAIAFNEKEEIEAIFKDEILKK